MSQEAVVLMKRVDDGGTGWGSWGDYDRLLPQLSSILRGAGKTLDIRTFFAEKDSIIGDAGSVGPGWLQGCIEREVRATYSVITHNSSTVHGADHNTVWDLKFGVPQTVFADVAQRGGSRASEP